MSIEARQKLVSQLVFQRQSQKADLLNTTVTNTDLIALLLGLTSLGWHIEITAVKTDHSDDSALGFHCHAHGFCVDCWPLASATPEDYLDANSPSFQRFLRDVADSPWLYQVGLAGSAWTAENAKAAGPTVFHDDGSDHLHLGAT